MTLQEIIAVIKTAALASGFTKVSEVEVNEKDIADTELPKMYIKLTELSYGKFMINTVVETYTIKLLIINKVDSTPITSLKTLLDTFMKKLCATTDVGFKNLINKEKVTFVESTLTNDIIMLQKLGGHSMLLTMTIENINNLE